jgi:hypothetical protein
MTPTTRRKIIEAWHSEPKKLDDPVCPECYHLLSLIAWDKSPYLLCTNSECLDETEHNIEPC